MKPRRILFWAHLIVGLTVSLVIGFLAITGSILAFQPQITAFSERHARVMPQSGTSCLAPSAMLASAAHFRGASPVSWTSFSDRSKPAEIAFPEGRLLLVDPCDGHVLDARAGQLRAFFVTVKDLHRYIAWNGVRHENLRAFKNAVNLAFVFLLVSGLILWFPRKWTRKHAKTAFVPRWKGVSRASEWSLHTVVGFWIAVPIVCTTLTGAIMGYAWANGALYRISGDPLPQARAEREPRNAAALPIERYAELDALIATASGTDPNWKSLTLRLPNLKGKELSIALDAGDGGTPVTRSQLVLNRKDGSIVRWDRFNDNVRARRWRLYVKYLHTGELFGLPGQIVTFLSTLGALLLVCTGISLSLRRFFAWRERTRRKQHLAKSQPVTKEVLA